MDSSNEQDDDARNWSIDRVVRELCHNPTPCWSAVVQRQVMPDQQFLEDVIRQNHLDGDNLLALDMSVLRDDLGLASFGQRRAMMKVIDYLRSTSPSYQQMAFQADGMARMQSEMYTPQLVQSRTPMTHKSPSYIGLGVIPSVEPRLPTRSPFLKSIVEPQASHEPLPPMTKSPFGEYAPKSGSPLATVAPQATRPSPSTNATETFMERSQAAPATGISRPGSLEARSTEARRPHQEPPLITTQKKKKKIAPTSVAQQQEVVVEASSTSYLPRSAMPLQDMFYHKISSDFGDTFYRPLLDESTTFVTGGRYPTGQRLNVASHIRHFFRQSVTKLPGNGALVKIPYQLYPPGRGFKPHSESYFTLFKQNGDQPRVFRAQDYPELSKLGEPDGPEVQLVPISSKVDPFEQKQDEQAGWTDFDYLLEKYPVEDSDRVLPVYGDSSDEGELDEETWAEIEAEQLEKNKATKALTADEVSAVIDEGISEIRQDWRDTKLPKIQLKAYRIWMDAARRKQRLQKLNYLKHEKERFDKMIKKIIKAMMDDIWHNANEVKKQCQSLEASVHQQEEFCHYETMLSQDTAPERPTKRALKAVRPRQQPVLEDGEELINSDSEPFSEIEEDFLVDDSSEAGSIHHEPEAESWTPVIPKVTRDEFNATELMHNADHIDSDKRPSLEADKIMDTTDAQANDADIETSDDEVITPARRKHLIQHSTPRTTNPNNVLRIPPDPSSSTDDDSEDDNAASNRPSRLSQTSARRQGRRKSEYVDLTFSSPERGSNQSAVEDSTDFSVHTPELNPLPKTEPLGASKKEKSGSPSLTQTMHRLFDDDSALPPVQDVERMRHDIEWKHLERLADECKPDRRRALAKALYELDRDVISKLKKFLETLTVHSRQSVLVNGLLELGGDDHEIQGVKARYQPSAHTLILLYITFVCGQNMFESASNLTERSRNEAYNDIDKTSKHFFELLSTFIVLFEKDDQQQQSSLEGTKKRKRHQIDSPVELVDDSDFPPTDTSTDQLELVIPGSAHKKRKRKVEESQEAKTLQKSDQLRIQEQEQRRQKMAEKFAQMTAEGQPILAPINTTEPYIHLHPHIAQRVKPHQLNGIQFMWREIIDDPKHQGCILAHTMGLGKTMQVISLLVTISICSQSDNPEVRSQIPVHLRKRKTLILCPATLVDNWYDELLMWTPDPNILGTIYKLDTSSSKMISDWARTGGLLLVSYERFRRIVVDCQKAKLANVVNIDLERILLDEPTLVVADEAHKLKNPLSTTNKVASQLKTTSRIALTGSPLNNHLEEYYTMVNWISPGYLGNLVQFKSKYSEPIIAGLYADSTGFQKRLALKKLHVLKRDLDPKIKRADISAIAKDMPPKTEFFITLPLTDIQTKAYNVYATHMSELMQQKKGNAATASIWSWMNMLSWLCHHPSIFLSKMKERAELEVSRQDRGGQTSGVDDSSLLLEDGELFAADDLDDNPELDNNLDLDNNLELDDNPDLDATGPMSEALQRVQDIMRDLINDPELMRDPSLSYRTLAVKKLIRQIVAVGDKVLIFSHSIPTLNFLEKMLKKMKCSYCRLDGSTKLSSRQAATKAFNNKDTHQVFLLSTRAGALGLNLQGANRVILFDFGFNPAWEEQAIGRAYRLNQKAPVFVYRFQAGGTFEDNLFNTSIFKTQLFGRVVDKKNPRRQATKKFAEHLAPVKEVTKQDFTDCQGKDPNVLDAIIKDMDFICKIVLTETFQKEDDERLNEEEQKEAEAEYQDQQLLRQDPVAYEAKKRADARKAEADRVANYGFPGNFQASNEVMRFSTLAHNHYQASRGPSNTKASTPTYPNVPPPFHRQDLDRPRSTESAPTTQSGWAYDDTFREILQHTDPKTTSRSVDDGDVPMNGPTR
ncbi:hypothetical protein PV08_00964 [Exophiala spinifera]|uniref:Uncharacterized protein n=1 Tax=Exophiala spinifera TaxID=91928 RepID=A0A0D2C9Z7_9EURO|nr:uncharacterized protein PV08_00964 [Exophiala spinifera]KIW20389.1 hypothetical protein PV08_00964 [Exophiala spinifera]